MKITERDGITMVHSRVSRMKMSLSVHYFLVDGLLIDTGPSRLHDEFIEFASDHPIEQVALTHHHEDHTGMAAWLQKHKDKDSIPFYLHESGLVNIQVPARLPLYRRLFWGKRAPFAAEPMPAMIETEKHRFQTIHTPGHAHDHVALYLAEKGMLFSGDLYLMSRPKTMFAFESVPMMIQSLRKVAALDFDTLICSHAGFIANGKKAIYNKLAYLEQVCDEVQILYKNGMDPREIRKQMFPKLYPINFVSAFESSPKHIIRSITKELEKGGCSEVRY